MGRLGLLAPAVAAAFPILFLYAHNVDSVTAASVLPVLLTAVLASALVTLALWRLVGDATQASLAATVWVILFLLYGHVYDQVAGLAVAGVMIGTHWVLMPMALGVAVLPLLPALLRWKLRADVMPYVTGALAILVALNLVAIGGSELARAGHVPVGLGPIEGMAPKGTLASQLPDIYYIVPDRYPSSGTLEEHFGYDNREFIDYLEDAGFYVAEESFANYHTTFLSLASSLNMDYLDVLGEELGPDTSDHTPAYAMLEDYRVWRILKEQYGYTFVHLGSWWPPTAENTHADAELTRRPSLLGLMELGGFSQLLFRTTLLAPFEDLLLWRDVFVPGEARFEGCETLEAGMQRHPNDQTQAQCHHTLHQFQQLREMPGIEGPKFVFVHLLVPHPPFVFGPDGELVDPPPFYYWDALSDEQIETLKRRKLDQIEFTNLKLRESIDHILAESQRPPVIIVQADEGPWTHDYVWQPPQEWTAETLRTTQRILNAYHLPGDARELLYPSISPVNTFRVVFNEYFGAELPLLEDRAYIWESPDRIYSFVDVTEQLRHGG